MAAGMLPPHAVHDAAHVAVTAVHTIDYLLTWNCKHLANAQIARRIALVCHKLGHRVPIICTPEESWEHDVMWEDPIVAEVHRTRKELAAKFDFDVKAIFADLRKRQVALGARLVRPNGKSQPNGIAPFPDSSQVAEPAQSAEL